MELKRIKLPFKVKRAILALGSQTKNTLCFAKGDVAYMSPAYPDLNAPKDFLQFEKTVKYFLKRHPQIIACDLHPGYQSTKYALTLQPHVPQQEPVQHHHAHIAACMAENGLKNQKVIGVAFDGTGLGSDNTIWGAEFLVCDYKEYRRMAHVQKIPLLGAERAILEPWRVAMLWLYLAYKERLWHLGINFVKGIDKKKWRVLKNMYSSGYNSPLASSMGRLFDAVGSMVFCKYVANFEAEIAMSLEELAARHKLKTKCYPFLIRKGHAPYVLEVVPMFRAIVKDLKRKAPAEGISYWFHLTVAQMIRKVCLTLRRETGIKKVILSGGVFQNLLLLSLSSDLLHREDVTVFTHNTLPSNDSSISLGQAVIAHFRS